MRRLKTNIQDRYSLLASAPTPPHIYKTTAARDDCKRLAMTTHEPPVAIAYVLPNVEYGVVRDIAIKTFYFSLVTITFVFVSLLLTGIHP